MKTYKSQKTNKKLVLTQDTHAAAPYKVVSMKNTIEWSIGERLRSDVVREIISRKGIHEVEVIIK